jgi:hypothetical protein
MKLQWRCGPEADQAGSFFASWRRLTTSQVGKFAQGNGREHLTESLDQIMSFYRAFAAVLALTLGAAALPAQVEIDHRYANSDAQSLIGLPMGSHKTIVDKQGDLKWSQWSLKRKPLDTPIGFSDQMDGELAIQAFAGADPLTVASQQLYRGRYPFVVSTAHQGDMALEELAFAVDPEAKPGEMPTAASGTKGLDVVRLSFRNDGAAAASIVLKLSGRERNLPGHVVGSMLENGAGEDVALVTDAAGAAVAPTDNGLTLEMRVAVDPHSEKTIWIELPYEWPVARNGELSHESGEALLAKAVAQWDGLWAHAAKVDFPQKELSDFYYSSIAYVLILTEFDGRGDLWALDGPAVYRQYWGRGEYFQARAMEVAGFMEPARESVEHAFHIINDDGEWDFPPTSGWPAWDNAGGNAAAVWDYYLFSRDKQWLEKAYPYLLQSASWIRDHREESTLEGDESVPVGARPIQRMIASKCRTEPNPPLKSGEKTYWYGLLPWSYGDSGLPEGHSFSHNFLADYAVKVTSEAATVLGHANDAVWLDREYAAFTAAIREDVNRAVTLETIAPPYLPAMPTYPEGAYSQSFLAVYPTGMYAANDPLVSGLIARMEREEKQGLPTNVAWAGPAGVWAGESMNMAETYLLRGEKQKTAAMLAAALNHSYTTNVWKEEILVDVDAARACDKPHSKRKNMEGTGDMPEAWANANLVLLLRDMLVNEREGKLHLLAGLPASWVPEGKTLSLDDAPVTTGGTVSLRVEHVNAKLWRVTVDPHGVARDFVLHFPAPGPLVRIGKEFVSDLSEFNLSIDKPDTVELEY